MAKDDSPDKGGYFDGLTNKSPPSTDKSMVPKGGSVNDDPVRKDTAKTPRTLGPRTA